MFGVTPSGVITATHMMSVADDAEYHAFNMPPSSSQPYQKSGEFGFSTSKI